MPAPFIVVPTFRERDNLPAFTSRVWKAVPDARLLVVDDYSGDGAPDWVRAQPQFGQQLFLLERASKLGLGTAYLQGFAWVLERHRQQPCSAVVQMDADLSHNPASIPDMLRALDNGADLVLATRYQEGLRVTNWPLRRLLLSLGAGHYVRLMTGMPFSDPTGGFKAFCPDKLSTLDLSRVRCNGYAFQVEITYLAWRLGWKIAEVQIVFEDRHSGVSKMSWGIVREAVWRMPWITLRGRVPALEPPDLDGDPPS
jgi:dolichol-phosphate mannosyltransferase